jgi:ribosome-associated protein
LHRLGRGCFGHPGYGYNPGVTERSHKPLNSLEQARRIAGLADSKLAQEIVILDMRPVCAYTDFFVICSGGNPRQTKSIVDEVRYVLKQDEEPVLPHSIEGEREGDWIVADYLDVVLHVFTPETRKYYGLEELWGDVPSIEHATAS